MTVRNLAYSLWILVSTRQVVNYYADDRQYGCVEIEVRANRVTGRRRRYIWSRNAPND